MSKEDLRLFRKRHRQTSLYVLLLCLSILLSMYASGMAVAIFFIIHLEGAGLASCAEEFSVLCFIIALCFDVLTFCYYRKCMKQEVNSKRLKPYTVKLSMADKSELLSFLHKNFELNSLDSGMKYCFIPGEKNIRLFVFEMAEYEPRSAKKSWIHALEKAKAYGVMHRMSRDVARKEIRFALFIPDSFTEEAFAASGKNASYSLGGFGGYIKAYIDLENMLMYIPAFAGCEFLSSSKYYYCISSLLGWL